MKKTLLSAVVATFAGTMAFAQSATDQIISDLTSQGFQHIEIDNGIGQIKVEAIRGTQKLEVIYDRATGNILKQEVERVRAGEDTTPGVQIRNRDRDFIDVASQSDDSRATVTSTTTTTTTANVTTGSTSTDQLVNDLQEQGFTRIEVKTGLTQTKVEAIRGTEKVETVFDSATGDVIKQEVETVDSDDDTRPGVEVRTRDRDFVDGAGSDDDDDDGDDDRSGSSGSDDDDGDDRSGSSGSDDDDDDDRSGSSGSDDDDDDDDDDDSDDDDDDDDDDSDDDDSDDDDSDDD